MFSNWCICVCLFCTSLNVLLIDFRHLDCICSISPVHYTGLWILIELSSFWPFCSLKSWMYMKVLQLELFQNMTAHWNSLHYFVLRKHVCLSEVKNVIISLLIILQFCKNNSYEASLIMDLLGSRSHVKNHKSAPHAGLTGFSTLTHMPLTEELCVNTVNLREPEGS